MSAIALSWVATIKVGNQTAKQLLQFYACHNFNKPGFEFKNKTLAEQLEVKERAIQRAHQFLIEKNLISRIPQYGKDGSQFSHITYLNIPQHFVDKFFNQDNKERPIDMGGVSYRQGGGELGTPLNSNINNKQNKNIKSSCSSGDEPSRFGDFWKAYPRKQSKVRAEKLWKRKKLDEKISLIISDIKNRLENDQQWKEKAYIPLPDTYLNNERWNDEVIKRIVVKPTLRTVANETRSTVREWAPGNPDYDRVMR